jgi:hypothetical protein
MGKFCMGRKVFRSLFYVAQFMVKNLVGCMGIVFGYGRFLIEMGAFHISEGVAGYTAGVLVMAGPFVLF